MRVYLVRHAIATPRELSGVLEDRSRELTPLGIRRMRRQTAALARLNVVIDEVWTSPYVRATQTAAILSEGLALATSPRVVKELAPGGDLLQLLQKLARHTHRTGIALIGHEPDLGILGTYLVTGTRHEAIEFKKGGVACVKIDDFKSPLRGRLCWLLTPKQMRLIA